MPAARCICTEFVFASKLPDDDVDDDDDAHSLITL